MWSTLKVRENEEGGVVDGKERVVLHLNPCPIHVTLGIFWVPRTEILLHLFQVPSNLENIKMLLLVLNCCLHNIIKMDTVKGPTWRTLTETSVFTVHLGIFICSMFFDGYFQKTLNLPVTNEE